MIDMLLWPKTLVYRHRGKNFACCRYRVYHDPGTTTHDPETAADDELVWDTVCRIDVDRLSGNDAQGYWTLPEKAARHCVDDFVSEYDHETYRLEDEDWPLIFTVQDPQTGKWFVFAVAAEFKPQFYLTRRPAISVPASSPDSRSKN